MVEALNLGSYYEKMEAAAIVQSLSDLGNTYRDTFLAAGALDALLVALQFQNDLSLPSVILRALASLCHSETVRLQLKAKGGIPKLLGALEFTVGTVQRMPHLTNNDDLLRLATAATSALSILSNSDQSKVVLREYRGINILISALKTFERVEEVQCEACVALSNLALDPASRFAIVKADGVEIICRILQGRPSFKVALPSLRTLAHVSRINESIACFAADAVSSVASAIGPSPDDEANMWACQVLANLSAHAGLRPTLEKTGAVIALCRLIVDKGGQQSRCTGFTLRALASLSSREGGRKAICSSGAVPPATKLLTNLAANGGEPETIACLLRLMSNVCTDGKARESVHEGGGTETILRIAAQQNPVLLKPAMYALSVLCEHPAAQCTICQDATVRQLILSSLSASSEISPIAACIMAKSAKGEHCSAELARPEMLGLLFHTVETGDEKTAMWAANCITNICSRLSSAILEQTPDALVSIISILMKEISLDVMVWMVGALAELSRLEAGASAIVELSGITLMSNFISTSTDGQVVEIAAFVLKNIAKLLGSYREFSTQGAIRPLVHLLRVSQERHDLENTLNVVLCLEEISQDEENGRALRQSGAVPLLIKLLGSQVGSSFMDLESEAAVTLTNIAKQDPGSLNIIRQAGAIPNLLSMLSVASYGINKANIPRSAQSAISCLVAITKDNDTNRKAVLNSSNFYAVESLRKKELALKSKQVTAVVAPLLVALQLPPNWLSLGSDEPTEASLEGSPGSVASPSGGFGNRAKLLERLSSGMELPRGPPGSNNNSFSMGRLESFASDAVGDSPPRLRSIGEHHGNGWHTPAPGRASSDAPRSVDGGAALASFPLPSVEEESSEELVGSSPRDAGPRGSLDGSDDTLETESIPGSLSIFLANER